MRSVSWRVATYVAILFPILLSACASGPKLADIQAGLPSLSANQGRIWFYRSNSPVAFVVQPAILLNGSKVGNSVPGGFFYVDTPSGPCGVTTATETDYSVKFLLQPAEERYVRTVARPGLLVGRIAPELMDPAEAREDLASKSYTGLAKPGA